jgi:hypothetical protein
VRIRIRRAPEDGEAVADEGGDEQRRNQGEKQEQRV